MRATIVAAISVVCALPLVACGTTARQTQAKRPAQLVADAVSALQHDLGTRNYRDLCEQVFSTQARNAAGGISCPASVGRESKGVENPSIDIRRIDVNGRSGHLDPLLTTLPRMPVVLQQASAVMAPVFEHGEAPPPP